MASQGALIGGGGGNALVTAPSAVLLAHVKANGKTTIAAINTPISRFNNFTGEVSRRFIVLFIVFF
jgi:hypothetical protein